MTSITGSRIQRMVTTARQVSFRMKQRAQQTRRQLERFVEGEAEALAMFLGVRPTVYLVPTIPALAFFKSVEQTRIDDENNNKDTYIVDEDDKLYDDLDNEELYVILKPFSDLSNSDLVWNQARGTSDNTNSTKDKALKQFLAFDVLGYAEQAFGLENSNFA